MTTIRVAIIDDHPVFRFGVQALLLATPDLAFAGEASTGAEAIALVLADPPDVVLMDLTMPGMNGINATRLLIERLPALAVLVLTMAEDDAAVVAALAAGARGYIVKGSTSEQIVRAIRSAADGQAVFSGQIASRLPGYFSAQRPPTTEDRPGSLATLTPREWEILELIAAGLTNAAIADRLYLSPKTVGNRVGEIFGKIGTANRNEAIVLARDAGLGRSGKQSWCVLTSMIGSGSAGYDSASHLSYYVKRATDNSPGAFRSEKSYGIGQPGTDHALVEIHPR